MPSKTITRRQSIRFSNNGQPAKPTVTLHVNKATNNSITVSFPLNPSAQYVHVKGNNQDQNVNLHSKQSDSLHYLEYSVSSNNPPSLTVSWTGTEHGEVIN